MMNYDMIPMLFLFSFLSLFVRHFSFNLLIIWVLYENSVVQAIWGKVLFCFCVYHVSSHCDVFYSVQTRNSNGGGSSHDFHARENSDAP